MIKLFINKIKEYVFNATNIKNYISIIAVACFTLFVLLLDFKISDSNIFSIISILITFAFFLFIFVKMIYTKQYSKYSGISMFILGLAFVAGLIFNLSYYLNLSLTSSDGNLVKTEYLIRSVIHTFNTPGTSKGFTFFILTVLLIWLGSTLALGRGFCSWVCPVGALDDTASRLAKNKKIKKTDDKWLNFPYAIMIVVSLLYFGRAIPTTQCSQTCPSINICNTTALPLSSFIGISIIVILIVISFSLVLPYLTKKRTFCSFICPIGKIQSLLSKISVFKLVIAEEKCTNCNKCIEECPSFAITEGENKKINSFCTQCLKCFDACSHSAISFKMAGKSTKTSEHISEKFFIYPAFMFMIVLCARMMSNTIFCILSSFVDKNIL